MLKVLDDQLPMYVEVWTGKGQLWMSMLMVSQEQWEQPTGMLVTLNIKLGFP